MRQRIPIVLARLLLLVAGLSSPSVAEAQVRGVVHQRLIALLNPMGTQHDLRVGFRAPLGDQSELLFDGAHIEGGAVSYLSPVFAVHGGYLSVSPLSFLVLHAEFAGGPTWPIGMDGAGYYGLSSYAEPLLPQTLAAERAGGADGWEVTLGATLQGAIPLGDGARLLLADSLNAHHATTSGGASHYYSMRYDLIAAEQDWIIENDAVALLDLTLLPGTHLLLGAYDATRYVPASGYVGHQVGGIAILTFADPSPEVTSVGVFVRGGAYTDHLLREEEPTILGGVSVSYDLGSVR
ncbi:MAG: hypothetical protein AAF548_07030 [Actinomycetota bacterium]